MQIARLIQFGVNIKTDVLHISSGGTLKLKASTRHCGGRAAHQQARAILEKALGPEAPQRGACYRKLHTPATKHGLARGSRSWKGAPRAQTNRRPL